MWKPKLKHIYNYSRENETFGYKPYNTCTLSVGWKFQILIKEVKTTKIIRENFHVNRLESST